jgi:hypothetical protein
MEKSRENKDKMGFVNEGSIDDVSKRHTKYLGTGIPEGYFETSKTAILDKIKSEIDVNKIKEKKQPVFWMRPSIKYMAAASLVFIFGMTVWFQNATKKEISNTNFELLSFDEDYLMNSLLVEDAEFEAFADAALLHEIIIKAEESERKTDALFLNSLFLDDSLIDDYTNNFFLEVIIL